MGKKNPDEEAAIKRARELEKAERETERRINELNRKERDAAERLRKLLEEDE